MVNRQPRGAFIRRAILSVSVGLAVCAGCAGPSTIEYKSDANGRWVKTVYSKSYISPKETIEGLLTVITGFDEGRVNPLASAIGALGPDSETPPASYVVHLKNTTQAPITVELLTLRVRGKSFELQPKTATIEPGTIFDTEKVMADLSLNSHEVGTELTVRINGQEITRNIILRQETREELNRRMKR